MFAKGMERVSPPLLECQHKLARLQPACRTPSSFQYPVQASFCEVLGSR